MSMSIVKLRQLSSLNLNREARQNVPARRRHISPPPRRSVPRGWRGARRPGCRTSSAAACDGAARRRRSRRGPSADRGRAAAGDLVEPGAQIAPGARLTMEGDGEAVRLVADPGDEEQRRAVCRQRDRVRVIAREDQFLLLGAPGGKEVGEPELLQRLVRRRELPLATVDQDQIGERAALLENLAIA